MLVTSNFVLQKRLIMAVVFGDGTFRLKIKHARLCFYLLTERTRGVRD